MMRGEILNVLTGVTALKRGGDYSNLIMPSLLSNFVVSV